MKSVLAGMVAGLAYMAAPVFADEIPPFQQLQGEIQARLAGIDFAVMEFSITLDNGAYIIETLTESDGVASAVWNYRSAVQATGSVDAAGIHPAQYSLSSRYWGRDRTTALTYDDAGAVIDMTLDPLPEDDEREAVPLALTGDSTDPASIFLALLAQQALTPGLCDFRVKLFDGYRLSQLDGKRPASSKDYPGNKASFAAEELQYCQADAQQLAGRRFEEIEKAKTAQEDQDEPQPADIWFARPTGTDIVMPVRVQKDTYLGLVEFQLQDLRVTAKSDAVLAWSLAAEQKPAWMSLPGID